jgi:hypothetical protein
VIFRRRDYAVRCPNSATISRWPGGLVFDSVGNPFVADEWAGPNGQIDKITPGGSVSLFADDPDGGPTYIAVMVPEPSAMGLVGLGLPALPAFRRRN